MVITIRLSLFKIDILVVHRVFVVLCRYRATIEHYFGFFKRYRILNSVFRGKIFKNNSVLTDVIKILIHSDAVYLRYHSHRTHPPILDSSRCIDLAAEREILMQQQQKIMSP